MDLLLYGLTIVLIKRSQSSQSCCHLLSLSLCFSLSFHSSSQPHLLPHTLWPHFLSIFCVGGKLMDTTMTLLLDHKDMNLQKKNHFGLDAIHRLLSSISHTRTPPQIHHLIPLILSFSLQYQLYQMNDTSCIYQSTTAMEVSSDYNDWTKEGCNEKEKRT